MKTASLRRKAILVQSIFFAAAALLMLTSIALVLFIGSRGLTLFKTYSPADFFFGTSWNQTTHTYGVIPLLYGSLMTTFLTLLVSVPLTPAFLGMMARNFRRASQRYAEVNNDCNDANPAVNPGLTEACLDTDVDEDCDMLVSLADPDCAGYIDSDGDTFCFVGSDMNMNGVCTDPGEQSGLGMQAGGIERAGGAKQLFDLGLHALGDDVLVARGIGLGPFNQRGDLVDAAGKDGGNRVAFGEPCLADAVERLGHGLRCRVEHSRTRLVVQFAFRHLDDAADRQQAVGGRRVGGMGGDELARQFDQPCQEGLVDARLQRHVVDGDSHVHLEGAAGEALLDHAAQRQVERVVPGRVTQADIQALVVDGLDLHRGGDRTRMRLAAGEAGHGLQ